jgi:carboxyl-terminal processing protease
MNFDEVLNLMKINNMYRLKKIVFTALIICGMCLPAWAQKGQSDFEISKNIDIFITLYKQLHVNYVDELNSGQLMKTAIDAMLESLDPYTVYIPESEIEDYKFMTTGQYGGIGSGILARGPWIYISDPYEGMPADKAGLRMGDKILEINGQSAKNKTVEEASSILKGQPGTEVKVLIERDSTQKPLEKTIIRQEIKISNVPYFGMVSKEIGYINLSEFRQNASKEVREAVIKLRDSNNMKGLIFDLRGNGGGLLNEAVNIVNIFVESGQLVVSTRGKITDKNNYHKTQGSPVDLKMPLVILVDNNSASASEIVTGAIQDLDRGVIIGQRSYGKGLVQNIIPLTYNAQMKVTVAKYYIPSGRCIQLLDYANKDKEGKATKIPDSLATAFKTKNGRTVYDQGGIEPDIPMKPEEYGNITVSLMEKFLIFDYSTKYYWSHPSMPPVDEFRITDEIYNDFISFLQGKTYDYKTESEKDLDELKTNAEKEKYFDAIKTEYAELQAKLIHNKQEDLIKFKNEIGQLLKSNIAVHYYYQKGRIQAILPDDPEVKKAIDILNDPDGYKKILEGPIKPDNKKP